MVQKHGDGWAVKAVIDKRLKDRIENAVESNPELSEARLIREGVRDQLEGYSA